MDCCNVLAWVSEERFEQLRQLAAGTQWRFHRFEEPEQARGFADERIDPLVGLLEWAPESDVTRYAEGVEQLMSSACSIEWVALLPVERLQEERVRRLISQFMYDYHTLPLDGHRLFGTLGHALGMARVAASVRGAPLPVPPGEAPMIGASPAITAVFKNIDKLAGVCAPLLLTGESGTGKELAARAVHQRSRRAVAPFVAVNCGALPTNLIQSELFGHERGAFTGAHQRKIGRLEQADGGTIFLDEIGDLSPELQVNLLRFLQEGTIERVGGGETIRLDVRVIAATHVQLPEAVTAGHFREDLFYRLNVLHLDMPPLRERSGDVELLAHYYFQRFAAERNRHIKGFSEQALQILNGHDWPGNIRELVNRVRRAMVMSEHRMITPGDLGLERRRHGRGTMTLEQARAHAEIQAIQTSLRRNRNNITASAQQLGVSRVTLYRLIEKHSLVGRAEACR